MKRTSKVWHIGNVPIEGRVGLAPMAGVCDIAYRRLAKEQGAAFIYTEMVSALGICYHNKKTEELLRMEPEEQPLGLQIFGSDPEAIAKGAQAAERAGAPIVDINMGCPVKKVVSSGDGSALMKTPDLAAKVTEAAVQAVSIPVTVKMRLGWDAEHINVESFAKTIEEAGASAITIHGRTREVMYSGQADWSYIKAVVEAVSIPVIGNGDVHDGPSAKALLEETQCAAVAVGRAAQGNPWVFSEIQAYLSGVSYEKPTYAERLAMAKRHFDRLVYYKGEAIAVREIRTHISWYTKGMPHSAAWRSHFQKGQTCQDFYEALKEYEESLVEGYDLKK